METKSIKLDIAIVDKDVIVADTFVSIFSSIVNVQSVRVFTDSNIPLQQIIDRKCNALLVDIFSIGVKAGTSLIEATREHVPYVPICLLGTTQQLREMPDVDPSWRNRFDHYYKLPTDQPLVILARVVERIARLLSLYLLSHMASLRIRDIRAMLGHPESWGQIDLQQENLNEALQLAQEALEAKQSSTVDISVVPGLDEQNLQALVQGTLTKASASLEGAANVYKRLLLFGGVLVASAFIVAAINGSWEAVTFGGMGLAGIVTALITNPLKGIAATARRLVQIQVAYIGFLHVLGTAGSRPADSAPGSFEKRIESINEAIRNILDTLEKHCQ